MKQMLSRLAMLFLIVILAAVLLPDALAVDFSLFSENSEESACSGSTMLHILAVENIGIVPDSYTVSLSGSASRWSVAAPSGFFLPPEQSKNIYVYITPPTKAAVGTYDLKITVYSSSNEVNSEDVKITLPECHALTLSTAQNQRDICAGATSEYLLTLSNEGEFSENYAISLAGPAGKWATLSEGYISLQPKESQQFKVFLSPPVAEKGTYQLSVAAKSGNSNAMASQNLIANVEHCYSYDTVIDKEYYSFCENSEVKIPIAIRNTGVSQNTFNLALNGPEWASLEKTKLTINSGSSATTNLVFYPGFGLRGYFDADITVTPVLGDEATLSATANVLTCHATSLQIERDKDILCPNTQNNYEITVVNSGEFSEQYAMSVKGPLWLALDTTAFTLLPSESKQINLGVSPDGQALGDYAIIVSAEAQGPSHTRAAGTLKLTIAPASQCYGVKTVSAENYVKVSPGESAMIPITVSNLGTETSTYTLDLTGSGANYVRLNPASLILVGKSSETVYAHIAVPDDVPVTTYQFTVSARLADGVVSSSDNIAFSVVEVRELPPEEPEQPADDTTPLVINRSKTTNGTVSLNITPFLEGAKRSIVAAKDRLVAAAGKIRLGRLSGITGATAVKVRSALDFSAHDVGARARFLKLARFIKHNTFDKLGLGDELSTAYRASRGAISGVYVRARALMSKEIYGYRVWMYSLAVLIVIIAFITMLLAYGSARKKSGRKGLWQSFGDWLEEGDEPADTKPEEVKSAEPETVEVIPEQEVNRARQQPKEGVWKRFVKWLEEDVDEKTEPAGVVFEGENVTPRDDEPASEDKPELKKPRRKPRTKRK